MSDKVKVNLSEILDINRKIVMNPTFLLFHPTEDGLIGCCSLLIDNKYYLSPISIFESKGTYTVRLPVCQNDDVVNKSVIDIVEDLGWDKVAKFIITNFEKFYQKLANNGKTILFVGDNVLMGFKNLTKVRVQGSSSEEKSLMKITNGESFH